MEDSLVAQSKIIQIKGKTVTSVILTEFPIDDFLKFKELSDSVSKTDTNSQESVKQNLLNMAQIVSMASGLKREEVASEFTVKQMMGLVAEIARLNSPSRGDDEKKAVRPIKKSGRRK